MIGPGVTRSLARAYWHSQTTELHVQYKVQGAERTTRRTYTVHGVHVPAARSQDRAVQHSLQELARALASVEHPEMVINLHSVEIIGGTGCTYQEWSTQLREAAEKGGASNE